MLFCVDRRVIGTEKHLVGDNATGEFEWLDDVPADAWLLTGTVKPSHSRCLDTVAKLMCVPVDVAPPTKFVCAIDAVARGINRADVPWSHVMPRRDHQAFVKKVVNCAIGAIDGQTIDYLVTTWVDAAGVLGSLSPAAVDGRALADAMAAERNDSVRSAIASLQPDGSGLVRPPTYDRLATATGRLTVIDGPRVLTLRRDLRRLFVSRHGSRGAIVSYDFAALEARIVMRAAGLDDHGAVDLYGDVGRRLFGGSVARSDVKECVLSLLFGAGRATIAERLGRRQSDLAEFFDAIEESFGFSALGRALVALRDEATLRNAYGRPLLVGHDGVDSPLAVSHFAQSTGVDVALLGFSRLASSMRKIAPGSLPLFVLHDALFIDAPLADLPALREIKRIRVPGFDRPFPVKFEIMSDT